MYSKIDSRFWSDEKIAQMSVDAKYLMLYLLTTPHRNLFGCYKLPKAYALEDTGIPEKRFSAAWKEIIKSGMIAYDEKTKTVLVSNFLKYNPIDGPKQVTGAISKLDDIPRTHLLSNVANVLIVQAKDKPYLMPLIDALHRACGTDNDTLSDTLSNTLSDAYNIPNTQGYSIPVTDNSNSISNNTHDEDDYSYPDTRARVREEVPEEDIIDYLEYSDTAKAISADIEPDEAKRYIRTAWKYHIGRSPNATNINDIQSTAAINQMQVSAISYALSLAARNASGSITGYTCECLKNWAASGYHTIDAIYKADIEQSGLVPLIGGNS